MAVLQKIKQVLLHVCKHSKVFQTSVRQYLIILIAAAAFECEECGYNITYKGYDLDEAEASKLRSKIVLDKEDVWNEDADIPKGVVGDYPADEKTKKPAKKRKNNNKKKERKEKKPDPEVKNLVSNVKGPADETRVGVRTKGVAGIATQLANHSAAVTKALKDLKVIYIHIIQTY